MPEIFAYDTDIRGLIARLVKGPAHPEKMFCHPGCPFSRIYEMAGNLAAKLSDEKNPGKPVCLFTQNRPLMAAALLAGLKTHTAFLVPHALSRAAINQLHSAVDFDTVITDNACSAIERFGRIVPDAGRKAPSTAVTGAPMGPDQPWIYLFTGGSTGRPKLWSKTPNNLLSEAAYLSHRFAITPEDRILATIAPYHIYGLLYSVLAPLLSSAGIVETIPGFPDEMISALEKSRATIFVSVPVHFRALKGKAISRHFLRLALSSAGPLSPEDGNAFSKETGCDIYEIYGSTETGGIACRCRAKGEVSLLPFDCVDTKIEGDRLLIRSAFISSELPKTKDGFFKVPDQIEPDRPKSDGSARFFIKGRTDSVVKVGGKRVDLEDVKSAIVQIKGVENAVVFNISVASGRENEILALVEGDLCADKIKRRLQQTLEPFAIPRQIKITAKIPCAATGKIDRSAIEKLFK